MPSPKPLRSYPPEFPALFRKAAERGAVSIPLSSPAEARLFRGDLYTYRTVLRAEALETSDAELSKLALLADPIRFHIEGSTLILYDEESETFLSEVLK